MTKDCRTCKYEETDRYDDPCYYCHGYELYEAVTEKRDKQIYSELIAMYITELDLAMGNDYNECDTIMRDVKKDKFMELLSEFKKAIMIELQEEEN